MTKPLDRLFVYGIFLDADTRKAYGMSDPHYAVVRNCITTHAYEHIVEAVAVAPEFGAALTGLIVEVTPFSLNHKGKLQNNWQRLDDLEHNYERTIVTTTEGEKAYMYAAKASNS